MTKQTLLPCPFCENEEYKPELNYDADWRYYSIMCQQCGAEGEQFYLKEHNNPKHLAAKAWNKRPDLKEGEQYLKGFLDCKEQFLKLFRGLSPEGTVKND